MVAADTMKEGSVEGSRSCEILLNSSKHQNVRIPFYNVKLM